LFSRITFHAAFIYLSVKFLPQVLEEYDLQIHHLTPNGFLTLSKFCWACESYGATPDLDTFCTYYELQCQPKKVGEDELIAQYGSYAFRAKRQQGGSQLEISWCQKNKWDKDWMKY